MVSMGIRVTEALRVWTALETTAMPPHPRHTPLAKERKESCELSLTAYVSHRGLQQALLDSSRCIHGPCGLGIHRTRRDKKDQKVTEEIGIKVFVE